MFTPVDRATPPDHTRATPALLSRERAHRARPSIVEDFGRSNDEVPAASHLLA
jgi:hypothetical protein